jgi:hypothetical protein
MMGMNVLLIEPKIHLGGLSSGGLGETDIGNKYAVTGLSRDFYRRLGKIYDKLEAWQFAPSKAEKVFNDYINEAGVEVLYWYRLHDIQKKGTTIKAIEVENTKEPDKATNKIFMAKVFIDATYEGDLMAKAGVSYHVGREANSVYNETLNGVQYFNKHQFPSKNSEDTYIDPYIIPGDSTSGLCYGIQEGSLAPIGSGDSVVQAYNYRLCMTQDKDNRVPVTRPEGYDSTHYELLRRLIVDRAERVWRQPLGIFYLRIMPMPEGKTDINNKGPFSTDFIGMNYDYPEADYNRRAEIEKEHEQYIRGLLYFLGHDPALPDDVKNEMLSWGWAKDEFTDNDYFPFQMYVREARRMIGEYVMTEHNCRGDQVVEDAIGLAAYTMDSHNGQRLVFKKDSIHYVQNAGDVQVGGFPPYPISYRALTPKREECTNLLVPVCLSASHIAFGSIRMEPVFMVMGQVTGVAAYMAVLKGKKVQAIDVEALKEKLEKDPLLDGTPKELLCDNDDIQGFEKQGNWSKYKAWESGVKNRYKNTCLVADSADEVPYYARFTFPDEANGMYEVYFYVPSEPDRFEWDKNVLLHIAHADGDAEIEVNMHEFADNWIPLGEFTFVPGKNKYLELDIEEFEAPVAADAVLLIPVK